MRSWTRGVDRPTWMVAVKSSDSHMAARKSRISVQAGHDTFKNACFAAGFQRIMQVRKHTLSTSQVLERARAESLGQSEHMCVVLTNTGCLHENRMKSKPNFVSVDQSRPAAGTASANGCFR